MFLTVALPESILILKFLGVMCNVSKMFQKRQGKVLSCGALESALYPVNITAYCALLCTKPLTLTYVTLAAMHVMQVALSAVAYKRQFKALSVRFSAMLRHTFIRYP